MADGNFYFASVLKFVFEHFALKNTRFLKELTDILCFTPFAALCSSQALKITCCFCYGQNRKREGLGGKVALDKSIWANRVNRLVVRNWSSKLFEKLYRLIQDLKTVFDKQQRWDTGLLKPLQHSLVGFCSFNFKELIISRFIYRLQDFIAARFD